MEKAIWQKYVLKRDELKCRRCGAETNNVICISNEYSGDFHVKNGLAMCKKCEVEYNQRFGLTTNWTKIEMYLEEKSQTLRIPIIINKEKTNSNMFDKRDFNIKTTADSNRLRDKMEDLQKELVRYAQKSCPNRSWDYYVTSYNDRKKQWGAIFPMRVNNHRQYDDLISSLPNIILDIPVNVQDIILALNLEFKIPRELLYDKCRSLKSIEKFIDKIKGAEGAVISVRKKIIIKNNRSYHWLGELWDNIKLPEIFTNQCNSQYLLKLPQLMKKTIRHNDVWYEPVFLIGYKFTQSEFISNPNITKCIGNRIIMLAPIVDFIFK